MIRRLFSLVEGRVVVEHTVGCSIARRGIAASAAACARKMPDRPPLVHENEFTESFLKGSGPGGQKINKTSSAVQLKHIPTGLVLKVQATRSRIQNRKIARQMLAERVEEIEKGKESRVAVVQEVKRKRKSSAVKKSKRKYRALEEAKKASEDGNGGDSGNQS
ncbi:peptidyl-tRNA hydrolase domain protein [Hyaloscypha finlandica]|nr:peptidyl-tRNA hydrolase domain protein [Hyaloscypha finlandica]